VAGFIGACCSWFGLELAYAPEADASTSLTGCRSLKTQLFATYHASTGFWEEVDKGTGDDPKDMTQRPEASWQKARYPSTIDARKTQASHAKSKTCELVGPPSRLMLLIRVVVIGFLYLLTDWCTYDNLAAGNLFQMCN